MLGFDDLLIATAAGLTGLITDVVKTKGGELREEIDIDFAKPNLQQAVRVYIQTYWKRHKILPGLMKEPLPLDSVYTAVKCLREWDFSALPTLKPWSKPIVREASAVFNRNGQNDRMASPSLDKNSTRWC